MELENIKTILDKLGLTNGEINVYLSLVRLQNSTVGNIIKDSKISSSKVYVILDKLIDKGLVSYILEGNIKYFKPNNPETLEEYVEKKENELLNLKQELKDVIEYVDQYKSPENDEAKIYKGFKGMKTAYFQAIKNMDYGEEYLFFSTGYAAIEEAKIFFTQIVTRLKNKNNPIKGLSQKEEKKEYEEYYKKLGYEVRFTDLKWPADITIIGENVFFLLWKEDSPVVYEINSKLFAESWRLFFNTIWKQSK